MHKRLIKTRSKQETDTELKLDSHKFMKGIIPIKNAKTKREAREKYIKLNKSLCDDYLQEREKIKIKNQSTEEILKLNQELVAIRRIMGEKFQNWTKPKPNYSKMTKKELIKIIEKGEQDE